MALPFKAPLFSSFLTSTSPTQRFLFPPFLKSPNFLFLPHKPFLGFHLCTRTMATPAAVHVKEKIDLSDKEKKIFQLLLDSLHHSNLQTQLRVAGGWVRDKVPFPLLLLLLLLIMFMKDAGYCNIDIFIPQFSVFCKKLL